MSVPSGLAAPTVTGVAGTSATVSWTAPSAPNGDITSYILSLDGNVVFNGLGFEAFVASLTPATAYGVQLQACNSLGCASASTSFTTSEAG